MTTSIHDRIRYLVEKYAGGKNTVFAKSIGVTEANIRSYINGVQPKADTLEKIVTSYDVNAKWLLSGEGNISTTYSQSKREKSMHNEIPIVGAMHEESTEPIETRPRIPFDAAAGSLSIISESVSAEQCEFLPLIPTFPRYDFTIIARGDSMLPDVVSGDELACALVKEKRFIQWGRTHVLDTAQGIIVKRIFNKDNDILCKSRNSDYPDFVIPKDEIYRIALVVGLIRHF